MAVALTPWLFPTVAIADQGNRSFWDALVVEQPGEGLDAARQRTLSNLVELLDAIEATFSPVQSDQESHQLLTSVAENLAQLDLAAVYRLLPYPPLQDGTKAILFDTRRESAGSLLMAYDANAIVLSGTRFLPAPAGQSSATARLRHSRSIGDRWALLSIGPPAIKNGDYTVKIQGNLRTGRGEPKILRRSLEGMIRYFEDLARQHCQPTEATRGELARTFPSAQAYDLALLESLQVAFPQTFPFFSQYFDVQRVGERMLQYNAFKLHLAVQLRQDRLAQDYPSFARWLKRVTGLFTVRSRLHDLTDHLVAEGSYDSSHHRLTAEAVFRESRLLPCHEGRHPLEGHRGYSFADPGDQFFRMRMSSHSHIAGIEATVEGLTADVTTHHDSAGFLWEQWIREMPTDIRVTGSLFGIIPRWLVAIVLRRGLDTIPRDFLAAVKDGPNGQGTSLLIAARKNEEHSFDLTTEVATKIWNNRLVRLGFEFGIRSYLLREAELTDIRRFLLNFLQQVRQDLTRQQRLWQKAYVP